MSSTRVYAPTRSYAHSLTENRPPSETYPYGTYKYESSKGCLPAGLFHFVKDANHYVPTLHGLSVETLGQLKEVAVCTATSFISHRPFLNSPQTYEVELINTGHETLRQGDRFTVQLPNERDVAAQRAVEREPGNDADVNRGIWGGLLATRRVNCEYGGDPVEEVLQAVKLEGFDPFRLISPYHPQSVLSMMTLIANGAGYDRVSDLVRNMAAEAVNREFNAATVAQIVGDQGARRYLHLVLKHAMAIMESVQGFAGGQVLRSRAGYNGSDVGTGQRFAAQLNMHRWLL